MGQRRVGLASRRALAALVSTRVVAAGLAGSACTWVEAVGPLPDAGSDAAPGTEEAGPGGATEAGAVPTDGPAPSDCPAFAPPGASVDLLAPALEEASGLVVSRRNAGVLWTHNDSGDTPRIFAVKSTGELLATITIGGGASAVDWEDMAIGRGPDGTDALFLGDIGDNAEKRAFVTVYRVAEPDLSVAAPPSIADVTAIQLAYEDGPHNAESLLVDPVDGAILIVTKVVSGQSQIFRAAPPFVGGQRGTLRAEGVVRLGSGATAGSPLATGASITGTGNLIFLRTYSGAYVWPRAEGQSVAAALAGPACPLAVASEEQGEAIAVNADGSGFYTVSEGSSPPLSFAGRR